MTSMPLLPAQPSTTPSAAVPSADTDAGPGGPTAEGRKFADLLAVGVGSAGGPPQSGSAAANRTPAEPAAKHPGQHRRVQAHESEPATAGVQPPSAAPAAGALPPQQPSTPARYAADSGRAEAMNTLTGKAGPNPVTGNADPGGGPRPGPDSGVLGTAGSLVPRTAPTSGSLGAPAGSAASAGLTGGVLSGPTAERVAPDFGNLVSQFGNPAMGGRPIASPAAGATNGSSEQLGHAAAGVLRGAPTGQPEPGSAWPAGTAGSPATAQPAPDLTRLDRVGGSSPRIPAPRHPASEHAAGRAASGPTTSGHPVLATGTTLPPAAAVPISPPAAAHQTASPATASPAMPTATAADPPMRAPLHSQVAGTLLELRARGDGTHRVLLELHPADLGQVTVAVRMHAGAVSIDLASANPDARHSLAKALPQLRAELADAGLGSASVTIGADTSGGTGTAPRRDGDAGPHRAVPAGPVTDAVPGSAGSIPSDSPVARAHNTSRLTGVDRWL